MELPRYEELPRVVGGARSAWGIFGLDDNVGLLNLQTPERVVAAARLVVKGTVFPLDEPLDFVDPPMFGRRNPKRHVRNVLDTAIDDSWDDFFPQASSQWDAVGHVGYRPNEFYNGATLDEVLQGARNTIEHWASRGIVGRAVLLDLERTMNHDRRDFDPLEATRITVTDLEAAREHAGIDYAPGDVLLLHTGFGRRYAALSSAERAQLAARPSAAGLDDTEDVVRYLWDSRVSAVASDNPSVEVEDPAKPSPSVWPPAGWPFSHLHFVLIGQLGLALGELWRLRDLADDCAGDGVYETLLTSAPLHLRGGIGSTANALAIK